MLFFFQNLVSVLTTKGKFENTSLFLRLGLPSTLVRHENKALQKTLLTRSKKEFEDAGFSFLCDRRTFRKPSFSKTILHDSNVISLAEVVLNTNQIWPVFVVF